eukprot:GHVQ01039811.1.p1 GENE.GHVQ01039811.1~~GHVQ01039811.1.p1  ORF type:complete len:453 (+),score=88.03 GHVQ01039811.1:911-2269(+)
MEELAKARLSWDSVKNDTTKLEAKLTHLQDTLKELELNARRPATQSRNKQVSTLENQLDKAMMKHNEALSIRRTYEQIVRRLREERVCFDQHLAEIEKTLKAKEKDSEELLLLSHDAHHAKEMAQAELHRFEQNVIEERQQRDKEVQEKKILVQSRVEANLRLDRRDQQRQLKRQQQAEQDTAEAAADEGDANGRSAESDEEEQKLQDYEEVFRRIKEATGVSDVNEVIQKFLTQEETQSNLINLTNESQAKIDVIRSEVQKLQIQLEELKYSGSTTERHAPAAEDFEAQLNQATTQAERNRLRLNVSTTLLVDAKAGLLHMADKLAAIESGDAKASEVEKGDITDLVTSVQSKIEILLEHVDVQDVEPSDGLAKVEIERQNIGEEGNDIRIRLPEPEDDDDQEIDDEMEDEINEEVWNRKNVKYHSRQILEKQQRSRRRKPRPTRSPPRVF